MFQEEPEGVSIIPSHNRTAFLFECKSAQSAYKMTADDKRAYEQYIKNKLSEVEVLDHAKLKYFVIVGPAFAGDTENRRNEIFQETGVLVVFLKASILSKISKWACDVEGKLKNLIDLGEIFSIVKDDIVTEESVSKFIENFNQKYKERY